MYFKIEIVNILLYRGKCISASPGRVPDINESLDYYDLCAFSV